MAPDDVRAFARSGMLVALGLDFTIIASGRVIATMPIESPHLQPFG